MTKKGLIIGIVAVVLATVVFGALGFIVSLPIFIWQIVKKGAAA